jgi:hypothetical protein
MDEEQIDRFRSAVQRKKQRSKADSERSRPAGGDGAPLPTEQPSLVEPGRPQDTRDPRAKNAGHGKKTADKWNQ